MASDVHTNTPWKDSEPRMQPDSRFLSLPAELIFAIVAQLSYDRHALCQLAQTCRLIHPCCEEHIYHTIELLRTRDLVAICKAFHSRPQRIAAVHKLGILYKYQRGIGRSSAVRKVFNGCLSKMTALREWSIQSPFDNFKWGTAASKEWVEGDMESFRQCLEKASLRNEQALQGNIGLSRLEKLVIHSHGTESDYWDLAEFDTLFRHPTLRYLHVSCIQLPTDMPQLKPYARSTPLSTLVFDECDLTLESLGRILSTPKKLKHLTIGENVFNIRAGRVPAPKLSIDPEAAVKALLPVAHSLETLTHIDPMFLTHADSSRPPKMRTEGDGMRKFFHLISITCDPCSFLYQGIIASYNQAPPNLERVEVRNYDKLYQHDHTLFDDLPDIRAFDHLSSLKTLDFVQPAIAPRPTSVAVMTDFVCEETRVRERHAYAYKLWKRGIRMTLTAEMHKKLGLIPPYLHGEPRPVPLLIYDSDVVGFHRDPNDQAVDVEPIRLEERPGSWLLRKLLPSPRATIVKTETDLIPNSTRSSAEEKEVPATDQLGDKHVQQLRNQVFRAISKYVEDHGIPDYHDSMFFDDDLDSDPDLDSEDLGSDDTDMSDTDFDDEDDIDEDELDEDGDDELDEDDMDMGLDLAEEDMEIDQDFLEMLAAEIGGSDDLEGIFEDADEFLPSGHMTIDELLDAGMDVDDIVDHLYYAQSPGEYVDEIDDVEDEEGMDMPEEFMDAQGHFSPFSSSGEHGADEAVAPDGTNDEHESIPNLEDPAAGDIS